MGSNQPRPYHRAGLRAALIDEVLRALESGTADALTMRELAQRVGVSHTAAYAHFADKSALWSAVAAVGFERLRAAIAGARERATTPADRLAAAGLAYLAFARSAPGLYRLMFGSARGARPPAEGEAAGSAFDLLLESVAALPVDGRPRPAATVEPDALTAWSLVHGLACLEAGNYLAAPSGERGALEAHAVAVLVRGLASAR